MEMSFPRETLPRQQTSYRFNRNKTQWTGRTIIKHTRKRLNEAQIKKMHFSVTWTFKIAWISSTGTRLLTCRMPYRLFQVQGAKREKAFYPGSVQTPWSLVRNPPGGMKLKRAISLCQEITYIWGEFTQLGRVNKMYKWGCLCRRRIQIKTLFIQITFCGRKSYFKGFLKAF